jgi:hypothetical protein
MITNALIMQNSRYFDVANKVKEKEHKTDSN